MEAIYNNRQGRKRFFPAAAFEFKVCELLFLYRVKKFLKYFAL